MKRLKNKIIKILILITSIFFLLSTNLYAVTIVLDPGHGGSDPGGVNTQKNLKEADINYKIATYLKENLEEYENVKVVLTRSKSENKTLQQRADVAFNNNANLLLSIHLDSAETGSPTGATGYVTYKTNFEKYNKDISKKDLAKMVKDCYDDKELGRYETVQFLDRIMSLGYKYATISGLSICKKEISLPLAIILASSLEITS